MHRFSLVYVGAMLYLCNVVSEVEAFKAYEIAIDVIIDKYTKMGSKCKRSGGFMTPYEKELRERERGFYEEYIALTKDGENSKMMVMKSLMKKYGYHSTSSAYRIIRKMEAEV